MEWQTALEIVGLIGGIATILALFLGPMFYLGAKIDAIRADLSTFKDEMYQEHKDFHGRLERQDAEFKSALLLLEERIKQ